MIVRRWSKDLICIAENDDDIQYLKDLDAEYDKWDRTFRIPYYESTLRLLKKHGAKLDPVLDELLDINNKNWGHILPLPLPSKRKQMEHQLISSRLLVEEEKFMLALDMGLGKTKCAVDVFNHLRNQGKVDRMLVVTEASMCYNWTDHLLKEDADLEGITLIGNKRDRKSKLLYGWHKGIPVFAINYDGIPVILKELKEYCDDRWVLVLDESSRVKDHKTKRFTALWSLFKSAGFKYVWLLTGTPLTQKPEDVFGQYCFVDWTIFGDPKRYLGFKATYTQSNPQDERHVVAYKNMDLFVKKLHSKCYRLMKDDVLDLPPKRYQTIWLKLPPQLQKVYNNFCASHGMLSIPGHPHMDEEGYIFVAEHPFSVLAKSRQIVHNYIYLTHGTEDENKDVRETVQLFEDIECPKVDFFENALENTDYQWVVWFAHKADRTQLVKFLRQNQTSFVLVDGDTPVEDRSKIEQDFRHGRVRVFLGQPSAAGFGLNLTPYEHSKFQEQGVIYWNNTYKCSERQQSEDRVYRIGTKNAVVYYDLIYDGTIEVTIHDKIMRKIDFNTMLSSKMTMDDPKLMAMLSGSIRA